MNFKYVRVNSIYLDKNELAIGWIKMVKDKIYNLKPKMGIYMIMGIVLMKDSFLKNKKDPKYNLKVITICNLMAYIRQT